MDTDTLRRDLDTRHKTDRFTALVIFASDHDFPAFAKAQGINYKPVMGLYQGLIGKSYVINHNDAALIAREGILKGQEAVLLLSPQEAVYGGNREVWLASMFEHGNAIRPNPKFIGLWHKVTCSEALHSDAWTCYPDEPAWYVTRMPETHLKPTCDILPQ